MAAQPKYLVQRREFTGGGSNSYGRFMSWTKWTTFDRQDTIEQARTQRDVLKVRGGLYEFRIMLKGKQVE